jgi:hypothetical protein
LEIVWDLAFGPLAFSGGAIPALTARPNSGPLPAVKLSAAYFSFMFAGYFAPQTRGGLSPRNV